MMRIDNFQSQPRLLLVVLLMVLGWGRAFAAEPFIPEKEIRVETRYSKELQDIMGDRVIWQILPGTTDNGFVLEYRTPGNTLFCSLGMDGADPIRTFTLTAGQKRIDTASGAFIPFPGFPAPCRIFPINEFDRSGGFDMMREAGGRKFLTRFSYEIQAVSPKEALEKGQLDPKDWTGKEDRELVWIRVRNPEGEILFSQLWEKGASWWLYEETDDSRSWKKD
jgi:hypothetical protein